MFSRISDLQFQVSVIPTTITGVRFIRVGGDQIAFSNAETTGTLTLSSTGLLNLSDLWETATALDWADYIDDNNIVGILATSASNTITVYSSGAVSPLAIISSGQAWTAGVIPDEYRQFYLDNASAATPSLDYFKFIATNEPAQMSGIFNTLSGVKTGSGFYYTVPNDSIIGFDDIAGGSLPTGAVGARFFVTGSIRYSIEEGSDTAPMTVETRFRFPEIKASDGVTYLGKT